MSTYDSRVVRTIVNKSCGAVPVDGIEARHNDFSFAVCRTKSHYEGNSIRRDRSKITAELVIGRKCFCAVVDCCEKSMNCPLLPPSLGDTTIKPQFDLD